MLMKPRIPIFSNPDNCTEYKHSYCKCCKSAYKHLIFSFRVDEKRANDINQQECVYNGLYMKRKLEEEFTGKSSGNNYLSRIHKIFCQKLFSSVPNIHTKSVSWIGNCVKAHNYAL